MKYTIILGLLTLAGCSTPTPDTTGQVPPPTVAEEQTGDDACVTGGILYAGADTWQVQMPDGTVKTPTDRELGCLFEAENS